ncbi:MAG: ABC transporter ATP-binding protein [Mycobacteriaceae bacterium]
MSTALDVRLSGVGRTFGRGAGARTVLAEVHLEIEPGETVALLGASGSGKSTLLRLVAGLDVPTCGEVRVGGKPVRGIESRAAVVFQEPRLLPWRSLAANVAFGLPEGTGRAAGRAAVQHWLAAVGLSDSAGHRPREVSGGMAQRAALARALVREPGVLLLDEPFAALDALTRLRMQDLVDELQRRSGTTVLLVTHDVDEALQLADRVVVLGPADDARVGSEAGVAVRSTLRVPGRRPRDRGDLELTRLRTVLLDELGVPRHVPA